jgi:hypothetical protein
MSNNKRECLICGKRVPYSKVIDGKTRNLANRKYCLDCSPFGKHNTSKNPHIPKDERKQQKIKKNVAQVARRRQELRDKATEYKGGKCCICGYNKCQRALSFHHVNPEEKSFDISSGITKSWDKLKEELDKCILVCLNCHMEIEYETDKCIS